MNNFHGVRCYSSDDAVLKCVFDKGYGIAGAGFVDHALPVALNRTFAGEKLIGYFLVGVSLGG